MPPDFGTLLDRDHEFSWRDKLCPCITEHRTVRGRVAPSPSFEGIDEGRNFSFAKGPAFRLGWGWGRGRHDERLADGRARNPGQTRLGCAAWGSGKLVGDDLF